VNTSCFRYGLKDLTPSRELLKLYHRLGGTVLTLGSDAHTTEHLGAHMNDVREILKEIGFKYFCTYKDMKPEYHLL
jgi:histidinol-phosphatase (PHP family)